MKRKKPLIEEQPQVTINMRDVIIPSYKDAFLTS